MKMKIRLVTWDLDDAAVIDVKDVVVRSDEEVIALAVGEEGSAAIAYRLKHRPLRFRVRSYTSKDVSDAKGIYGKSCYPI
jgi:hypothetical protein